MLRQDHLFHFDNEFLLEAGGRLSGFQLKYTTLGQLNHDRSNVVWVVHALTGNSDVTEWWRDLFVEGSPFDPRHHFIICANTLGGCYGSTGPLSINPDTGKNYFHSFPLLTNRDMVAAFDLLRQHLGIDKIHTLIGPSLGGQQALEWAIQKPETFEHLVLIATNAVHSPWGIAFNEAQRMAISADATWKENDARAGLEGMKAARAIGMISYRAYDGFEKTQLEKTNDTLDNFRAATYQRYQGQKLAGRFNAFTYWLLSKAMDSHNVGRGRESVNDTLKQVRAKTLVVGIETDFLFPVSEQKFLAEQIPNATLKIISSDFGHDGFLVEFSVFRKIVRNFFAEPVWIEKNHNKKIINTFS
ncbi:MAG: Homoserine O-acetyltransferase [Cytophagales bacterium]|jgi:homoserine O-acetyltransferase|nr:homoserine O-acetyltransferase [Bacteroidota bacterium]MBS1980642.1 homoserine O-acetyltransferase [Bacteroidota bacterium]WHZ07966.1 MAG: Homoserine O-acetyltransferase [Cytophagales bacterium]